MMAVIYALKDIDLHLQINKPIFNEIDFYIDNQATLHSINQVKIQGIIKNKLILAIKKFYTKHNISINFYWVKGHSGVYGNELADGQAKLGAQNGPIIQVQQSLTYIKSTLKKRMIAAWNNEWNRLVDCRQSRKIITYIPSKKQAQYLLKKRRKVCRKLVALLTGHNFLRYHLFKLYVNNNPNFSPCCRFCENDVETSWHLLMECPRTDSRRRERLFDPDNPKTGPDIAWWHGLATHLGFLDLVTDRSLLEHPDVS